MTALVYVRIPTAAVMIVMLIIPTLRVAVCRERGSTKFDCTPGGGWSAGISSMLCADAMITAVKVTFYDHVSSYGQQIYTIKATYGSYLVNAVLKCLEGL